MSFTNYSAREFNIKLVYSGPLFCGCNTNLNYLYTDTAAERKGRRIVLKTGKSKQTMVDFLYDNLGQFSEFAIRLNLYTIPAERWYDESRRLMLRKADGICLVLDSEKVRWEANCVHVDNLRRQLEEVSLDIDEMPLVVQYNKRDLPNPIDIAKLKSIHNPRALGIAAVAKRGVGVNETLHALAAQVLACSRRINNKLGPTSVREVGKDGTKTKAVDGREILQGYPAGTTVNISNYNLSGLRANKWVRFCREGQV